MSLIYFKYIRLICSQCAPARCSSIRSACHARTPAGYGWLASKESCAARAAAMPRLVMPSKRCGMYAPPNAPVRVDDPDRSPAWREPEEDVLPPIAQLQLCEAVGRRQVVAVELGAQAVGRARLANDRGATAELAHGREEHVALLPRHAFVDGEG